jgi:hypothetical protein
MDCHGLHTTFIISTVIAAHELESGVTDFPCTISVVRDLWPWLLRILNRVSGRTPALDATSSLLPSFDRLDLLLVVVQSNLKRGNARIEAAPPLLDRGLSFLPPGVSRLTS